MGFLWKSNRRKIAVSAEFDFDIQINSHSVPLPTAQNNFFSKLQEVLIMDAV